MLVGDHPRAPVSNWRGLDSHARNISVLAPAQLMHLSEAPNEVLIARLYHYRSARGDLAEGAQVGVVHMRMGQQDEIQ
jgi:hypothetical protein